MHPSKNKTSTMQHTKKRESIFICLFLCPKHKPNQNQSESSKKGDHQREDAGHDTSCTHTPSHPHPRRHRTCPLPTPPSPWARRTSTAHYANTTTATAAALKHAGSPCRCSLFVSRRQTTPVQCTHQHGLPPSSCCPNEQSARIK